MVLVTVGSHGSGHSELPWFMSHRVAMVQVTVSSHGSGHSE